jgi:lipoyl(octanoyl) transferase
MTTGSWTEPTAPSSFATSPLACRPGARAITDTDTERRLAHLIQLGLTDYREAWRLQRAFAAAVTEGTRPDSVIFLEHPPTVTLGRRSEAAELHLPPSAAPAIVETDRGGRSTFHGPGQFVCYPILDLRRHRKDVRLYCRNLELAIIATLESFGIEGRRIEGLTGVWTPTRSGIAKIASIGVHIRHWVTTHGFALNVDLDPAPFTDWITACGLEDTAFTSMSRELGAPVTVSEVAPVAARALERHFDLSFEAVDLRPDAPPGARRAPPSRKLQPSTASSLPGLGG